MLRPQSKTCTQTQNGAPSCRLFGSLYSLSEVSPLSAPDLTIRAEKWLWNSSLTMGFQAHQEQHVGVGILLAEMPAEAGQMAVAGRTGRKRCLSPMMLHFLINLEQDSPQASPWLAAQCTQQRHGSARFKGPQPNSFHFLGLSFSCSALALAIFGSYRASSSLSLLSKGMSRCTSGTLWLPDLERKSHECQCNTHSPDHSMTVVVLGLRS